MKNLRNLKYAGTAILILGLLLLIGCSRTENPLGSEGKGTEPTDTFHKTSGNDATIDEPRREFFDHFERDLSKWAGKFGGEHHAVIVKDPLRRVITW